MEKNRRVPLLALGLLVLEAGLMTTVAVAPVEVLDVPAVLRSFDGPDVYRTGFTFPQTPMERLNWGILTHRSNVAGFDPTCAWPYLEALWYVDNEGPAASAWIQKLSHHDNMVNLFRWDSPIVRLLNARYALTHRGWQALPCPLPRFWIVHRASVQADRARLFLDLQGERIDPLKEAVLETGSGFHSDGRLGIVECLSDEGNTIGLRVRSDARGMLIASIPHYPGWKATVDGTPTPVSRADGMLMAVPIEGGEHDVRLTYAPPRFRLAATISLVSAGLLLLIAAEMLSRGRRKS